MNRIFPCIFGTTKGFEIVQLQPLPVKMQDLLVAISHSEVELSLQDTCIKMFRIRIGSEIYTWIGLYRKAYEMDFSREGGYYGAGIWLSDTTANARQVIDVLEDLAQQIRRLALASGKFQRPLSSIVQQLVPSQAFSALVGSSVRYINGGISADAKKCAFISQPDPLRDIVDWAQNGELATYFQSIIIAPASAFPKAGAAGNITQYANVATLERALEQNFVVQLTKLDAQNKDLQRRALSLEADAEQRSSEIQVLTQRNKQLETEVNRLRLPVRRDTKSSKTDYSSLLRTITVTLIIICSASVSIVVMLLGWLHIENMNKSDQIDKKLDQMNELIQNISAEPDKSGSLGANASNQSDEAEARPADAEKAQVENESDGVYYEPTVETLD